MNSFLFWTIIIVILLNFCSETILNYLNHQFSTQPLPEELKGIYDEKKKEESQNYQNEKYLFSLWSSIFSVVIILLAFFLNFFAALDEWVRIYVKNETVVSLAFFGVLFLISDLLTIPFSLYNIFVIEEKYGFNKVTWKIYLFDKIKTYLMAFLIGGSVLYAIIYVYSAFGEIFWIMGWLVITLFSILAIALYSSVILPLFNKLKPLEEGQLKSEIEYYCKKEGYQLKNLYVMDGSKRSTKANAFFSGLGAKKKIVLFDTLIVKLSVQEVTAVLAHEIGHYKRKHTLLQLIISSIQTLILFVLLGWLLQYNQLSEVLNVETHSFHIAAIVFFLLYSPISMLIGIISNTVSRKNEFEADEYANVTYSSQHLSSALVKLSVDSLSNLTPHPWYVAVYYSHPTLSQRLRKLSN